MFDMALIDECKHNEVPTKIVQAIIKEESSKNPFSININKDGRSIISYHPKTKKKAKLLAKYWIDKGYSVDVGLMQINSTNFKQYNLSLDRALNACTNIKVASTIYYKFFNSLNKNTPLNTRIYKAFSAYNTGSYSRGFKNGYVAKYKKYFGTTYVKTKDLKKYARYLLSIKFSSSQVAYFK